MNALVEFISTASVKELTFVFLAIPGSFAIALQFVTHMLKEEEQ